MNELGNNIAEAKLKYLMLNNSNNTYLNDYQNGFYFGYNYRPENYSMINGSVCNNDYAYNGIIFGKFKCPIKGFNLDETICCDEIGTQFCCKMADISLYYYIFTFIFFVLILIIIMKIAMKLKFFHESVPTTEFYK